MSTRVRIVVKDCASDGFLACTLHGRWWWHASIASPLYMYRAGFARSEAAARRRAEAAAKRLKPDPETRYTLEV